MATKKSAGKKTEAVEPAAKAAPAKKTAAKKTAAPKTTEASQPKAATATTSKGKPTHHDIERHAYLLWEREGKPHGHHDKFWHQAERELNS